MVLLLQVRISISRMSNTTYWAASFCQCIRKTRTSALLTSRYMISAYHLPMYDLCLVFAKQSVITVVEQCLYVFAVTSVVVGSRPSDHYFRSVCWFVCLSVCLFVCAEFFSAIFELISIKLGHMLYVWV